MISMKATTKLVLLGSAALAGVGLARQQRAMANVAAELRGPQLLVPLPPLRSGRTLQVMRRVITRPSAIAEGVEMRTLTARANGSERRVLVYERPDRVRPSGALLWIHGGGYVMGTPEVENEVCSRIALDLGVLVVNVSYRLAPEHPFPAGLDDCYTALAWLHEQADELGIDPDRVAIGGASAGGGMAASLAQMAHDRGGPSVSFQLLVYPMLDDRTVQRPVDALVWNNRSNAFAWGVYLGHPAGQPDERPWAVPARRADLAGLPPAWIGVGDIDLFHDEDVEYARRLQEAGVHCELHVEPGMYHGADAIAGKVDSMRAFRTRMVAVLGEALTPRVTT
jgi:acetyl esterase/lipase